MTDQDHSFSFVAGVHPVAFSAGPRRKKTLVDEKPRTGGYEPINQRWWKQPRDLPLFTFGTIQQMLLDGQVRLSLAMRAAPIHGVEWAYQDGVDANGKAKWTPGIKASSPEVAAFVQRQLKRIWQNYLPSILSAQAWGWSAGEITLRLTKSDLVEIDRFEPRRAEDCRMIELDGQPWGVRFDRIKDQSNGHVDLRFPRAFFHAHCPEPGEHYGNSILLGAYTPWADKVMNGGATDVRRLFMVKDAYRGARIWYPPGQTFLNDQSVPNMDIARQIVEQLVSGGVTTLPSDQDEKGNQKWQYDETAVTSNPQHILEYPKDLDTEIRRGMEIPDDVIDSESTGAWAGKRVPQAAFYASLDYWVRSITSDFREQCLDDLVKMNFGDAEFEIEHKPLADQAMEQQSNAGEGQQQEPPSQPAPQPYFPAPGQQQRFSIDAVDAVGQGVLDASSVVAAARLALRTRDDESGRPSVGDVREKDGKVYRLNKNRRWQRMAIDESKGVWRTGDDGQRVFIDGEGNVRAGGPSGKVIGGKSTEPSKKKTKPKKEATSNEGREKGSRGKLKRRTATIQQASEALAKKGFNLGKADVDLRAKKTSYLVQRPDGKQEWMTTDKIIELANSEEKPNAQKAKPSSGKVTKAEADAATEYSTRKYQEINSDLRSGKQSKHKSIIAKLDSAIEKSKTTEPQQVYRAAKIPAIEEALKSGNIEGLEFTDQAYSSTSKDKSKADNFARDGARMFKVNVPEGASALDVGDHAGGLKGEQEVLLPRGSKFKVKGIQKVKEKVPYRDLKGKVKYRTQSVEYVEIDLVKDDTNA